MNKIDEMNQYLYDMCTKSGIKMTTVHNEGENVEMYIMDNTMYTFFFDENMSLTSVTKDMFWQ